METEEIEKASSGDEAATESASEGSSTSASEAQTSKDTAVKGDPAGKLESRLAKITAAASGSGSNGSADEAASREVSAATIGRMLGLATSGELKLMEGKIDLLSTRVNTMTVRMEKMISILSGAPTGSDLERIDMQVGALRVMLRDGLGVRDKGAGVTPKETPGPGEKGDRPVTSAKIVTNSDEG